MVSTARSLRTKAGTLSDRASTPRRPIILWPVAPQARAAPAGAVRAAARARITAERRKNTVIEPHCKPNALSRGY